MKIRRKYIVFCILGTLLIVSFSTQLTSNLWGVLTGNGYIIPKESSFFTFKVTEMNLGSGDYWLYGEDKRYYYSQMVKEKNEPYIKILKEKADSTENFNQFDFETWSNGF